MRSSRKHSKVCARSARKGKGISAFRGIRVPAELARELAGKLAEICRADWDDDIRNLPGYRLLRCHRAACVEGHPRLSVAAISGGMARAVSHRECLRLV